MVEKILLANPRGFCAGVDRAIEIVEKAAEKYGMPIFMNHQIVHNEYVVNSMKKRGVMFNDYFKDIPKDSVIILSAHGSAPNVIKDAEKLGLKIIDAACPLVTKIHSEAKRFHEEEYSIILIGKENHQEAIGIKGEAPMTIINSVKEAKALELDNPEKIAFLTQTTLSVDDTWEIVQELEKKFPNITCSKSDDICYATQNRQDAVKELAKESEVIFVVGSKKSSNSNRLVETAKKTGVKAFLIEDETDLTLDLLINVKIIGVTSGASTPEILVKRVVEKIENKFDSATVEEREYKKENTVFILPKELR